MNDDSSGSAHDSAADWFPLDELTTRLAGLVWVERHLSEVLGSWVASTAHASTAIAFSRAAQHHAWHASIVSDVLATSPQLAAADRIAAPTEGWQRAIHQMTALTEVEARLASIVRVANPWLDREIGALRDLANPVSDREHDRLLQFVSFDHDADHRELAELLTHHEAGAVQIQGRREIGAIDLR